MWFLSGKVCICICIFCIKGLKVLRSVNLGLCVEIMMIRLIWNKKGLIKMKLENIYVKVVVFINKWIKKNNEGKEN